MSAWDLNTGFSGFSLTTEFDDYDLYWNVKDERWIGHYSIAQKILVVGDGDFSFSSSLADAFVSAPNITATSLDSLEFLKKNYGRALSNINNLKEKGSKVIHGVDAMNMASHEELWGIAFDRIIFNFPHAGFFPKESRKVQLSLHQTLVSEFLRNAVEMIEESSGEIHITHKTNYGFHREWEIESLGYSQGLVLIDAVPFDIQAYPGYQTKYGFGGDRDFDCNPSITYMFGFGSASIGTWEEKEEKEEEETYDDYDKYEMLDLEVLLLGRGRKKKKKKEEEEEEETYIATSNRRKKKGEKKNKKKRKEEIEKERLQLLFDMLDGLAN